MENYCYLVQRFAAVDLAIVESFAPVDYGAVVQCFAPVDLVSVEYVALVE